MRSLSTVSRATQRGGDFRCNFRIISCNPNYLKLYLILIHSFSDKYVFYDYNNIENRLKYPPLQR